MSLPPDPRLVPFKMALTAAVLSLFFSRMVSASGIDDCNEGLECCAFTFLSREFNDCCTKHNCCPENCDNIIKDTLSGTWVPKPDDLGFYECCVYDHLSTEYLDCCKKYNVCPDCRGSSRDCCYNGKTYQFGKIVSRVPECCAKLVCGARVSSSRPFVTAVIVPVEMPSTYGQHCGKPEYSYCVQANGVIRMEGSEWFDTPCSLCTCVDGVVTCRPVRPVCPPAPRPHCIQRPGDCCPVWDCSQSTGCVDEAGIRHNFGDKWEDPADPCFALTCTPTGIHRARTDCPPLPPPPHSRCTLEQRHCCYSWICPGCVDSAGVHYEEGSTWEDPDDPCTVDMCTSNTIISFPVHCPTLPPKPHSSCTRVKVDCCDEWNCASGCVDSTGTRRQVGEKWEDPTDPCYTLACTTTGTQRSRTPCPSLPPQPHPNCTPFYLENCCYNWTCPQENGCMDETGTPRQVGEKWEDPTDPCFTLACTSTGIQRNRTPCPSLPSPPHKNCTLVRQENCCYIWTCPSGCVDETGTSRQVGDQWEDPVDPCFTLTCTPTGIERNLTPCPSLPPQPHKDCVLQHLPNCCYNWSCFGCMDDAGVHHEEGSKWTDPADACTTLMCTSSVIIRFPVPCPQLPPRPDSGCIRVKVNCCDQWNCTKSGCVDSTGTSRQVGDQWKDPADTCFTLTCTLTGIQRTRLPCPSLPPQPRSDCTLELQPNCCYSWTCPGCVDEYGVPYEEGSTWRDQRDPCTSHMCTNGKIVSFDVPCPPLPPKPHSGCIKVTVDCCEQWKCTTGGCTDRNGQPRSVGEEWSHPSFPCDKFRCTSAGIITLPIDCLPVPPPPRDGCTLVEKNCCFEWDCPDESLCVDNEGNPRNIGDTWNHASDPCISHLCVTSGVVDIKKICPALPPRPSPDCVTRMLDCCDVWDCLPQCPDPESHHRSCVSIYDQCSSDAECYYGRCCLVAGCGKECVIV